MFFSVIAAVDAITSVWPSAAALATCSVPIRPLAPGRFSTTTVCPHSALSFGASVRASVSAPPAGGNGTTIVTVRLGKVCAAATAVAQGDGAGEQDERASTRQGVQGDHGFGPARGEKRWRLVARSCRSCSPPDCARRTMAASGG